MGVNRRQPFSGCRWWLPVRHQLVPTERSDGAPWCLVFEQRERLLEARVLRSSAPGGLRPLLFVAGVE